MRPEESATVFMNAHKYLSNFPNPEASYGRGTILSGGKLFFVRIELFTI